MSVEGVELSISESVPVPGTIGRIPCCLCGVSITPNATNMCPACLAQEVDLISSLEASGPVTFCGDCGRYLHHSRWLRIEPESADLLAFCINNKLDGIPPGCKLVDSSFVWTEPHSMRLNIRIVLESLSAQVRQAGVVELVLNKQQCGDCKKTAVKATTWTCCVQLRQRRDDKSQRALFLALEQRLIKEKVDKYIVSVQTKPDGMDFYMASKSDTKHLLDFLKSSLPVSMASSQPAKQSSTYTYPVLIAPFCRYDLVLSFQKKHRGKLLLVDHISSSIHFVDPVDGSLNPVTSASYWRSQSAGAKSVGKSKSKTRTAVEESSSKSQTVVLASLQMAVEFEIIDVELLEDSVVSKNMPCIVTCAKSADFGVNDTVYEVKSHLGHILKPGDTALGYDIASQSFPESVEDIVRDLGLPDVVLVKKIIKDDGKKKKKKSKLPRIFKALPDDGDEDAKSFAATEDIVAEEFLGDLEEQILDVPEAEYKSGEDKEDDKAEFFLSPDELVDDVVIE